jgi:protein TonB
MDAATIRQSLALDWLRVGAWSGSFAAHVVVLLLIALPMAVPPQRPPETTLVARWIESAPPLPALPEPPPPSVPHHERSVPVRAVPAVVPTATNDPSATNPIPETEMPAHAAETPAATADIASGGATQTLAYATPLSPKYPPASMRAHEQGTVILHVLVDENGVPQRIEIARSSGHARLDTAARESVEKARFRPVMRNGVATPAWGLVPIAFRLDRG